MTTTQDTLRSFGITRCYKGVQYAAYAIQLAVEDESRLEAITKEIYEETAEHFGCNGAAVERSIRTVVDRAWKIDSRLLREIAGYNFDRIPTASEFIEIMATHILRSSYELHSLL